MPALIEVPANPDWEPEVPLLLQSDRALGAETEADQDGDLNLQTLALAKQTKYLKNQVDAINAILGNLDTETLADLDLTLLTIQEKEQTVSIADGDQTRNIDLSQGAIVRLNCGNSLPCTLTFSNPLPRLSGLLILTASSGQDREIILPATWGIAEISRTLVIRATKTNTLPFEVYRVGQSTPTVVQELVIAGSLSPNLLMPT